MNKKLYVGNISYQMVQNDLTDLFSPFGEVTSVKIITDPATGRSKGFAFVELNDEEACNKAIAELDGKEFQGRGLRVSLAKPQPERGARPARTGGFGGDRGGRSSGGFGGDRDGNRGGFGGNRDGNRGGYGDRGGRGGDRY
jgi:RNA recognition motif-containing protein